MPEQIGPYRVVSELAPGVGAMGRVFVAQHTDTLGLYAIKLPKNLLLDDPQERQNFINEGDVLKRLRHENIVRIFETGVHENTAYIVMEYVDGESLHDVMKRERTLSPDRVLELARGVATGLQAAHAQGVIHRDIKPANILIRKDGCVKIADFGVARVLDEQTLIQSQMFVGAYRYAAPEVAEGTSSARSDLYSLGVVMYEALVGVPPFDGTSFYEIMVKKKEKPPDISALKRASPILAPVVVALLQPDPRKRPAFASALLGALDGASGRIEASDSPSPTKQLPVGVRSEAPPPRLPRDRALWIAGIAGGAVLLAFAVAAGAVCAFTSGGGVANDATPTAIASPTVLASTSTPLAVAGYPQQTLISYSGRTLTASVSCGEGNGLRGLDALDPNTGVLFDLLVAQAIPRWGAPGYAFPIDVVFINDQKTITAVFPNVQPEALTATSAVPVRYALEVSAGGAEQHGLRPQEQLAFDSPCEQSASAATRVVTEATPAPPGSATTAAPTTLAVESPVPSATTTTGLQVRTDRAVYAGGDPLQLCLSSTRPARIRLEIQRPDETVTFIPNAASPATQSDSVDGERCLDLVASTGSYGERTVVLSELDADGDIIQVVTTTYAILPPATPGSPVPEPTTGGP